MPKTIFKVTDKTGLDALWTESHVVYIPCAAKYDNTKTPKQVAVAPKLFVNVDSLDKEKGNYTEDEGFKAALYLLSVGLPVLLEGVLTTDNGNSPSDTENPGTITDPDNYDSYPVFNWKRLQDKNLYDIKFVTSGKWDAIYKDPIDLSNFEEYAEGKTEDYYKKDDIVKVTTTDGDTETVKWYKCLLANPIDNEGTLVDEVPGVATTYWELLKGFPFVKTTAEGIIELVNKRKDCIAILNLPKTLKDAKEIREYVDNSSLDHAEQDGNIIYDPYARAAAFVPSVHLTNDYIKSLDWVHGTWDYLGAYGYAIKRGNPSYYAMAGSYRGTNPDVDKVYAEFNLSEVEVLQARAKDREVDLGGDGDNIGVAINPIVNINPYGILVWGNRTLIENKDANSDNVGELTASSFLNIECMVATINKRLYSVANKYRFEPNSDILWFNVQAEIIPFLNQIKSGNGILAYKLERVEDNARGRIVVRLTLVPIEAVEDFVFEVDLTDYIA